jgi:hypothetical protein
LVGSAEHFSAAESKFSIPAIPSMSSSFVIHILSIDHIACRFFINIRSSSCIDFGFCSQDPPAETEMT